MRGALSGLLALAVSLGTQAALADQPAPTREECLTAHQSAQEMKRKGELVEAQAQLAICSSVGCPGAIISDCGQWIADLEQTTPSIVFDVRLDGKQVSEFVIHVDGAIVSDPSKAFKVNPGRHVVRAEIGQLAPQEETLALPEGQRMRLVNFDFKSAAAEPSAPTSSAPVAPVVPTEPNRPTPVAVYPLLVVGGVGLAGFGVLSFLGKSKQSDLEDSCKPHCTDEDLKPMKTNYLIGDIAGGVGVAALIGAGIVYLARPTEGPQVGGLSVQVGAATPRDRNSLAISVSRTW
ncbi:MAG: hypothetical protein QM756_12935 [Polyangiaceae bacterium]